MADKPKASPGSGLIEINMNNREQLKRLVEVCFPLTYKDEFYLKVVNLYQDFSRFIVVKDITAGGVVCRIEIDEETKEPFIHLLILLVLKKYRRLGLASKMLKFVYEQIEKLHPKIPYIDLHVQKINEAAVGFYKNEGFEVLEDITNYYTDIENGDALHMRKYLKK